MQRALSVLLVDLINVIVGGTVGMTILVFYHPYFLLYDALLLIGLGLATVGGCLVFRLSNAIQAGRRSASVAAQLTTSLK